MPCLCDSRHHTGNQAAPFLRTGVPSGAPPGTLSGDHRLLRRGEGVSRSTERVPLLLPPSVAAECRHRLTLNAGKVVVGPGQGGDPGTHCDLHRAGCFPEDRFQDLVAEWLNSVVGHPVQELFVCPVQVVGPFFVGAGAKTENCVQMLSCPSLEVVEDDGVSVPGGCSVQSPPTRPALPGAEPAPDQAWELQSAQMLPEVAVCGAEAVGHRDVGTSSIVHYGP